MPPAATSKPQLERWLRAFYRRKDESKVGNAAVLAETFFTSQDKLDAKLKEKYEGKGLRLAARLCEEVFPEKRAAPQSGSEFDRVPKKAHTLPGAKRFIPSSGSALPESRPPSASMPGRSLPAAPMQARPPPARPSSSGGGGGGGGSTAKGADKWALSEDQMDLLKEVKESNLPIQFVQTNPKNFGSASYERYEKYKAAHNVTEFKRLGGVIADIQVPFGFLCILNCLFGCCFVLIYRSPDLSDGPLSLCSRTWTVRLFTWLPSNSLGWPSRRVCPDAVAVEVDERAW